MNEPDQDKIDRYIDKEDVDGLSEYLEDYPISFLKRALSKLVELRVKRLWGSEEDE